MQFVDSGSYTSEYCSRLMTLIKQSERALTAHETSHGKSSDYHKKAQILQAQITMYNSIIDGDAPDVGPFAKMQFGGFRG